MTIRKVNLADMFGRFQDQWSPKIVGEVNDSLVKLTKLQGEFVWHHHDREDELFLVVKGRLRLKLRDKELVLGPGEDRKSTRLNSSHGYISYAVFCLKKKKKDINR